MNVLNKGNLGRRILKRLLSLIIVVWGVVTLSFCLQVFTGTDPAEMIVRKNSLFATEEQIQIVREQLGLDAPFHERYMSILFVLFIIVFLTQWLQYNKTYTVAYEESANRAIHATH